MTITIPSNVLKAALLHCAARKEPRDYLRVVHVAIKGGKVTVEATDGNTAFRHQFDSVTEVSSEHMNEEIIIPVDAVKYAVNGTKTVNVTLEEINGLKFKSTESMYPDLDKIFPERGSLAYPDRDREHFDFELLAKCQKSLRLATGYESYAVLEYSQKPNAAYVHLHDSKEYPICVVMGVRIPGR